MWFKGIFGYKMLRFQSSWKLPVTVLSVGISLGSNDKPDPDIPIQTTNVYINSKHESSQVIQSKDQACPDTYRRVSNIERTCRQ